MDITPSIPMPLKKRIFAKTQLHLKTHTPCLRHGKHHTHPIVFCELNLAIKKWTILRIFLLCIAKS